MRIKTPLPVALPSLCCPRRPVVAVAAQARAPAVSMDVAQALERLENHALRDKAKQATATVQRTFDLYGLENVAFSFNGGKDSTVLLHIIRAAAALHAEQTGRRPSNSGPGFRSFFFELADDFREIVDFTKATDATYGLHMDILEGEFRTGLESYISRTGVKAIILGTRRGDPNAAGQATFVPSSPSWPPFMRVNPVFEWTYADVWAFLQALQVPYCHLYDEGYTSIGATHNTQRNSALQREDGSFAPAHTLSDGQLERAGRSATRRPSQGASLSPSTPVGAHTAALVVVGDEILAGKVEDVNSRFLCQRLRGLGWRVKKVVVVSDEVDRISAEIRAASQDHDIVITSGGVGPTHDDVTMAALAEALGYPLQRNEDMEGRLRGFFGKDITKAHLKMAETPAGEVVAVESLKEDGTPSPFPVILCRNVYVLPGIPSLLQRKWEAVAAHLASQGGPLDPFRGVVLRLGVSDETTVAPLLERVSAAGAPQGLAVGSYPVSGQADGAKLVVSLEAKDAEAVEEARTALLEGALVAEERDAAGYSLPSEQ